ncbi:autotransporter translocation and assembly factor TamB [Dysgonomonas alginatilytica]|uniref:Autotransporter translocation and assembly factor TamB n=1 Tax=Dysgonomonas alginatilytica TaxID=1605892 RepID=A0A2V3PLR5_9BACT|nr:translocation/assembly module TamB domain-containing protein [Dysgonomonas alginatilytica]PXV62852.1 autotransporter translocation and assembly factor TamB [Dysgonomonas alginatilytica]
MDKEHKETETNKPPKRKNYIKKTFKVLTYIILSFIALIIILYGVLSIPAVQRKLVDFALGELRTILKTEVRIDGVSLRLFNHVNLKGVYVEDQAKDTLIYAGNLDVHISPWSLLRNKLLINEIELEDVTANLSQQTSRSDFNFQFIIDAFSSSDTTAVDTTKSSLIIDIVDVTLKNARLRYDILSDTITPGVFNSSHINISDLNANLKLPSIDPENLNITLVSLALKEQTGLEIKELKAHLTSDKTIYYLADASLNLPNSVLKIPSAHYNMSTNDVALITEQSKLSPLDLVPFMPGLKYLQHDIMLETSIKGKLPLVNIENLLLSYGDETNIKANGSISNYERYDLADLSLDITNFLITPDAIVDFAKLGDSTFVAPDMLKTLGNIRLNGNLNGKLSNLNIKAEAWARQGSIQMLATGSVDTTFQNYNVRARLQTQNFNLGSLLANPELGRLSMNLNLNASQTPRQALRADVRGQVNGLQYHRQNYSNIPFTAYYNSAKMGAWIKADLPAGKLEAKADMTQTKIPTIDIDMSVEKLQVDRFIDSLQWKNPLLSFHLKGNIIGLDPAKIQGDVVVEDFVFSRDSLSFIPGRIELKAGFRDESKKFITLHTSLLNADIEGEYNFMTLSDEIAILMNQYLPGIFPQPKYKRQKSMQNNFTFSLALDNTENLSETFDLPANVIKPMIISGVVNTKENKFKAIADIPLVEYGTLSIQNTRIDMANTDTLMNLLANTIISTGSEKVKFGLTTNIESDTINALLTAKTDSGSISIDGSIKALANLRTSETGEMISYVRLSPTDMNVGKLKMTLMPAEITNEGTRTTISNFGFTVGNNRMLSRFFGVDGVISDQPTDTLNVSFFNAHLGDIFQAFDINNVSTIADGNIKVMNVLSTPELYTNNMTLSNIIVFNDTLGDLTIKSRWSEEAGAIALQAKLQKVNSQSELAGWVYPDRDSLRLKLNIDKLDIAWIQPFVPDMLNRASGSISTGLNVTGRISAPLVHGWVGVNDAYLGIDYTNVTYHISDTISIEPDKIGFDNLIVEDSYKNKATISALVTHTNFEDMKYTLDMKLNNLLVLNTANRTDSLFYGKVFASGTVNVKGSDDLIDMKMKITNGRNSTLNVQIPQTSQASVFQSIVYINVPEQNTIDQITAEIQKTLPLRLSVDLTVTPDFQMGVVINPVTGDAMQVKGSGLIKFSYDMQSEAMNAFGDYTVSDGSVRLRLQNIKTIEFRIREGSKLVFNGDPLKTNFDITAFRRVTRADLTVLDRSFGDDPNNSPRVDVDAELMIKGNMDKMDLKYDITLPNGTDEQRQRVRSLIATDEQKITQFAFLVATGSFHSNQTSVGGNVADGLLTSVASSALSSGLNSLLGNTLGDKWAVGANIASNDGSFSDMDMTVSLSRKFMEDKLEFNSNLGYRTDQSTADNSFIGDFDISYALSRNIKVKVFNQTNERLYRQAPTTQGVGLVYTKEAKRIKELFQAFKKRRKRPAKEVTESTK